MYSPASDIHRTSPNSISAYDVLADQQLSGAAQTATSCYQGIQSAAEEKMKYSPSALTGAAGCGASTADGISVIRNIARRAVAGDLVSNADIKIMAAFVLGVNAK